MTPKYGMYKSNDETITHIISECPKLLQKECKQQHDSSIVIDGVNTFSFFKRN